VQLVSPLLPWALALRALPGIGLISHGRIREPMTWGAGGLPGAYARWLALESNGSNSRAGSSTGTAMAFCSASSSSWGRRSDSGLCQEGPPVFGAELQFLRSFHQVLKLGESCELLDGCGLGDGVPAIPVRDSQREIDRDGHPGALPAILLCFKKLESIKRSLARLDAIPARTEAIPARTEADGFLDQSHVIDIFHPGIESRASCRLLVCRPA
jgi:hypothetical protein